MKSHRSSTTDQPEPWYRHSYRRSLLDMPIEDWSPDFLKHYDPGAYARMLDDAGVDAAMIYANSHVGHCYWPTRTGHAHGAMGNRDWLRETIGALRKRGLKIVLYYSVLFNNWCYEQYPAWRVIDCEGNPSRTQGGRLLFSGARYGVVCPNNHEYRRFVADQMGELLSAYDVDGYFFDMCFWTGVCYCPSCRARFEEETGELIPRTVDWDNPVWRMAHERRSAWIAEFGMFCSDLVHAHDPGLSVEHNSAMLTGPACTGVSNEMVAANDYIGGDLYGGILEQSFAC